MQTIQEKVAEKIAGSGENIADTVVNKLAEVEISKRVDILTQAIKKQEVVEKEFKKVDGKDDVTTYIGGAEVKAMSKARFDEIKKAKENVDKLNAAIEEALTKNTTEAYTKLDETLKKLGNAGADKA
jgi:predicted transcriptional regulator